MEIGGRGARATDKSAIGAITLSELTMRARGTRFISASNGIDQVQLMRNDDHWMGLVVVALVAPLPQQ